MTVLRRDGVHRSSLAEWMRAHPGLDSRNAGLAITDIDWVIHRYVVYHDRVGDRTIQHIMFLEEKTHSRDVPFAQRDTLHLLSQFMPTNPGQVSRKKVRTIRGDWVQLKWWGLHVVKFSGAGPLDSELIEWDGRPINLNALGQLLRFDLSPLTLRPISDRRHHVQRTLPLKLA